MWVEIQKQNSAIMRFIKGNIGKILKPNNNVELCAMLDIDVPKDLVMHNYKDKDITVYVHV
jgi:hypothetical protein